MAKSRNVVDMVVARLPPPDRFKSKPSGGRSSSSSYDDSGDDSGPGPGELSAVEDFCAAIGVRPKDVKAACSALRDLITIVDQGEDDKEEADEGDNQD